MLPMIGGPIQVPMALQADLRLHNITDELMQIGPDIWITHSPVGPHTDNTPDYFLTSGCILINDACHELATLGQRLALPVGTLYRIDGHVEHATIGPDGLFAALIWDMPPEYSFADFERELLADPRWSEAAALSAHETKEG